MGATQELSVFAGVRGVVSIANNANYFLQGRKCTQVLPRPFYIDDFYLSLPWMNNSRPVVYPAYNYKYRRSKKYRYELGGLGGMIMAGRFKALALKENIKEFDGASLSNFERLGKCGGLYLYKWKPTG